MADLRAAQSLDLGDFFAFQVERTTKLDRLVDGIAVRYRVTANLEGRRFEHVTLDVGFDQEIVAPPDLLTGPDYFAFAGIPPVVVPALPLEQHIAEKLHAYSRIYADGRQSTRVKDLIDLVLIAEHATVEAERLQRAIDLTFSSRSSQAVPTAVPAPPSAWVTPYRVLATETGLNPDVEAGRRRRTLSRSHPHPKRFGERVLGSQSGHMAIDLAQIGQECRGSMQVSQC
jgi:hypothetical protein